MGSSWSSVTRTGTQRDAREAGGRRCGRRAKVEQTWPGFVGSSGPSGRDATASEDSQHRAIADGRRALRTMGAQQREGPTPLPGEGGEGLHRRGPGIQGLKDEMAEE